MKRRSFLKGLGVVFGAVAAGGVTSEPKLRKSKKKSKVGRKVITNVESVGLCETNSAVGGSLYGV